MKIDLTQILVISGCLAYAAATFSGCESFNADDWINPAAVIDEDPIPHDDPYLPETSSDPVPEYWPPPDPEPPEEHGAPPPSIGIHDAPPAAEPEFEVETIYLGTNRGLKKIGRMSGGLYDVSWTKSGGAILQEPSGKKVLVILVDGKFAVRR
jgi:hypothetical protein